MKIQNEDSIRGIVDLA